MRIMYHQTDNASILYGLSRPSLGRCDSMLRLKIFLKKVGLSQPSFRAYRSENNKKKKLLLHDDDGTNNRIKNPAANDNRTFGLVSDDDYPNSRCPKCTILTIYNNNNNNNYNPSENNVDNNSNDNDHDFSFLDYYNSSVLTGSKPYYTATERNANDDTLVYSNNKNKKSEKNADNNSNSNNNNRCADSDDNKDNNKDGNFISASTPPPPDSNADNAPPGRNNKNNVRLPRFIGHPNGIVFRVFKRKRSKPSLLSIEVSVEQPDTSANALVKFWHESISDIELKKENQRRARSAKHLPSFISHPNGILLRVFKKQRSMIEKQLLGPSFICHPNGIVLKVLNQKLRPRKQSTSSSSSMERKIETEMELAKATRYGTIIRVLNQISSSLSMVKMETETKRDTKTKTNRNAEQRVKQLKRANQQHYSHAHYWPPQQQYKSKSWTIAIILKLTFVAWDSWTYRIGY